MRSALRLVPRHRVPTPRFALRAFSSADPLRLKEDKAQDPDAIEAAKQEQMKTGKRKEELQSQSEVGVKADREQVHDHEEHKEDLQKQTAKQMQQDHPHGKS